MPFLTSASAVASSSSGGNSRPNGANSNGGLVNGRTPVIFKWETVSESGASVCRGVRKQPVTKVATCDRLPPPSYGSSVRSSGGGQKRPWSRAESEPLLLRPANNRNSRATSTNAGGACGNQKGVQVSVVQPMLRFPQSVSLQFDTLPSALAPSPAPADRRRCANGGGVRGGDQDRGPRSASLPRAAGYRAASKERPLSHPASHLYDANSLSVGSGSRGSLVSCGSSDSATWWPLNRNWRPPSHLNLSVVCAGGNPPSPTSTPSPSTRKSFDSLRNANSLRLLQKKLELYVDIIQSQDRFAQVLAHLTPVQVCPPFFLFKRPIPTVCYEIDFFFFFYFCGRQLMANCERVGNV